MFLIILNTSKQEFEKMTALVAEDEIIIALDIAISLRKLGYIVPSVVNTGEELLNKYYFHNPDLVITDIMLKGKMDGEKRQGLLNRRKIFLFCLSPALVIQIIIMKQRKYHQTVWSANLLTLTN